MPRHAHNTVRDRTGRPVSLYDPMPDWIAGRDEPVPREILVSVIRDATGQTAADRRRLFMGLAAFLLLVLIAVVGVGASIVREGRGAWGDLLGSLMLTAPAVLAMLAAGVWLPLALAKRSRLSHLRQAMLRHARCPHCAYDLAAVPAQLGDGDPGVVVCPECGCAWPRPANGPIE